MTEHAELSAEILEQLEALNLDPNRPLIISDADEVLLRFIMQLEIYLDERDMWIDIASFRLAGNIKKKGTDEAVEQALMPELLNDFFAHETANFKAVEGAAHALQTLRAHTQIMVLTNLPIAHKQARIDNLKRQGMDYPLVVGSGLKGPAVKWLNDKISAPVFFFDDISYNINSAAECAPTTHCVHMIADPRLQKIVEAAEKSSTRIDDWTQAVDWVMERVTGRV